MAIAEASVPSMRRGAGPDATIGAPVAVVGMAVQLPGAPDLATYWHNILTGVDATSEVPADRWDPSFFDPTADRPDRFYCRRGGFLAAPTFDPTAFGIMPVAVDDAEPDQLLALQVAQAAVDDAGGIGADRVDPERTGIILGRGGYLTPGLARLDQRVRVANQLTDVLRSVLPELDDERLAQVDAAFRARLGPDRPEAAIGLVPNLAASRVANRLDLRGPAFTVDAACASSLIAVEHAVHALRAGRCDVMLAGGVHHCHDVTFWSVFTQLGALSRQERIRPFDRAADGLLIGEGTGVVVLKRLDDAERDGDRVYAVIRGVGSSSDGRASSLMKPRVSGQVLALRRAWADAGLDPATIGLVEAHGTATPAGDETELATLAEVFGPADDRPRAGLGSVKSMIGHTMPTAGVAGLVKAALALHHATLPPSLHCDDPHEGLDATRFRVIHEAEPWGGPGADEPRRAAVNAFGFGGINGHLVLDEWRGADRPTDRPRGAGPTVATGAVPARAAAPAELPVVLRLSGSTVAEVRAALDRPDHELLAAGAAPDPGGPVRLALVAPTPERIARARKVVDRGNPWRGRSDLWFTAAPLLGSGGGRLAFCHPGVEPTFAPQVDDLTDHFGLPRVGTGEASMGQRVRAIVELGRALHHVLDLVGVRPDLVLGHSIGEWTGMNTAGHIPPDRFDAFADSVDIDQVTVPDAWYVALGCSATVAAELIEGVADVVVSHDNCPHQSMACGPDVAVEVVLGRARERRILAQKLPFRSGFHSPLIADHLGPFLANFERLPLQAPHTPLWSATTGRPYPSDPDEVLALAVRHLVEPVAFGPLVAHLHEVEGVRAVVQVGDGSLVGFVDDALRGRDVLAVSASDSRHPGLTQLARTLAGLWVEGLEPDWAAFAAGAAVGGAVGGAVATRPAAPPATTGAGRSMPLHLGAPLVHLGPDAPVILAPGAAPGRRGSDRAEAPVADTSPLGRRLADVLASIDDATSEVAGALAHHAGKPRRLGPRPAPVPGTARRSPVSPPPSAPGGAGGPAAGPAAGAAAGTCRTIEVSTAAMPWLVDHCFYRQPDHWADDRDRFPVVPMTAMVELMAQEVARAVPGRVVVALRSVRALRWLAAAPATEVTIRTGPVDGDEVTVAIDGHARAVAVLADAYPAPPLPEAAPLTEATPSARTAAAMYAERMMFHGPAYQGVTELRTMGPGGIDGTLVSLAAPGGLLDSAGQVMGYWMMLATDVDRLALPVSIDELAFFDPQPPVGEAVEVTVRITGLDPGRVRADLELVHEGRLWCRIAGWEDRRFQTDELIWPLFTRPEEHLVTEAQPGGWDLVTERWPDAASRELVLRRYTSERERTEHATLNPRAQRTWLLGRVAVKDAVRRRLRAAGAGPMFPVEVGVDHDERGRPVVTVPAGSTGPSVTLAHVDGVAVALTSDTGRPGIDLVALDTVTEHVADLALVPAEAARLPAGGPERTEALARLWAVKEAAGKAAGTGLAGRPRHLVVDAIDGSRHRVGATWIDTTTIDVGGRPHVVAWTTGGTP